MGKHGRNLVKNIPRWRGQGVENMNAEKENFFAYNPRLRLFANELRKNMTKAESCLWKYALRAGMRQGYTFRRQRPVLNFIADFMCKELKLIIEVDGITHSWSETADKDKEREDLLKQAGFHVLRFTDEEVLHGINRVIEAIDAKILEMEITISEPKKKRERRVKATPLPPPAGDTSITG
jgi:very-short-patch-repair endonuclease